MRSQRELSEQERRDLMELISKSKGTARKVRRAHTQLLANKGKTDREIAKTLPVGPARVERTRKRFVEGGLDRALNERPRVGATLDGTQAALLTALGPYQPYSLHAFRWGRWLQPL